MPVGCLPAQGGERLGSNYARLVETPLGMLHAMQRNWDNEHRSGRFGSKLQDGVGEQLAQPARSRT